MNWHERIRNRNVGCKAKNLLISHTGLEFAPIWIKTCASYKGSRADLTEPINFKMVDNVLYFVAKISAGFDGILTV